MAKKSTAKKAARAAKVAGFIASNPIPFLIALLIIVIIVIYTMNQINSELIRVMELYDMVGNQTQDSKGAFDKRLYYITVDEGGNTIVTIGYKSEAEKEQAEQAAEEAGDIGGGGTTIELSADAEQVRQALLNSQYAAKADSMAMIYQVCMDYNGDVNMAIGYMVNSAHEGNYGVVQYGKTVPNWTGTSSATSTQSNPLIVSNSANIAALEAVAVPGNTIGVGIVQWTYYTRLQRLCDHYRAVMSGDTISLDQVAQAERNWFNEEVSAYYDDCNASQQSSGYTPGSAQAWVYSVCVEFERPANKIQKGIERANAAQNLIDILEGIQ